MGFPTTRWSAIRGLESSEAIERERSWDAVSAAYWRPVYKHLRLKWKKSPEDAEDLTQSFFASALERYFLSDYDPTKARFRTFVRLCVDRLAANTDKSESRVKRGGKAPKLDFEAAENELASAKATPSPEELFDREYTRALLTDAIDALRRECDANEKSGWFSLFERYDLADERPTYEALARDLDLPVTTITNRLSFMRRELRRIVQRKLEVLTASDDEQRAEAARVFGEG